MTVQFPLWQKQKEAVAFCKHRGEKGWGLLCDRGTGKTRITIKMIEYYISSKNCRFGFICAPLSVMRVWTEEWAKWGLYHVLFIDIQDTRSEGLRKARELADAGWPVICLINYESVYQIGYHWVTKKRKTKGEEYESKEFVKYDTGFEDYEWDFGILDESHKIKVHTGTASKFLRSKLGKSQVRYRGILTGSSYTKNPLFVWAQIVWLTGNEVFQGSFTKFKDTYSIPNPYIRGAIKGFQYIEILITYLNMACLLLKKKDVVDIPPTTTQVRYLKLEGEAKRVYKEMYKECYAELEALEQQFKQENEEDGGKRYVTAAHVFTKTIKLRQIIGGFITPDVVSYTPAGKPIKPPPHIFKDNAKVREVLEILEDREDPTIIVVQQDAEEKIVADAVEAKFKFRPKILNGSVKPELRTQMIRDASKDLAFIVKEEVGCRGMDMRAFDMTVYYSRRAHTEAFEQMNDRNNRGGQDKSITYVHLLYEKTYDERIYDILLSDIQRGEDLEKHWRSFIEEDEDEN
jgi:SNF2 family DNA or RNA helicase